MTTLASALPSASCPAARAGAAGTLAVTDIAGAEQAWRELERTALMAPYGRFDWVAAYAAGTQDPVRVALLRDRAGRPVFLLPVTLGSRVGARVAFSVGGKHANFTLPLVAPGFAGTLGPDAASCLLREAGRALGVDAFALSCVPAAWDGAPVAWAAAGRPSPSDAWSLALERTGEATLARSMSAEARKKLRGKTRGLAKLGPVALVQARTEAEVEAILDAFLRQKTVRFQELGIDDPFAGEAMGRFLRLGARAGLADGSPAIELYGLKVGERFAGILGGAADRTRLSGMFISFEGGDLARYSPGEILVTSVIARQCEMGRAQFDLGVGDARYKRRICDGSVPLLDVVIPITARGHAFAAARRAAVELKRRVKASPAALRLIARARKALAPFRQGA